MALVVFFWIGCSIISYVYLWYPILVTAFARLVSLSQKTPTDARPRVTMIFCVYNEQSVLAEKVKNCKSIDYPGDLLEFYVGSDGSTDGTNTLLQSWADRDPRVHLILNEKRAGKTTLLNRIVPMATGDILLFSDASTLFSPDAIRNHIAYYSNPAVGCVGGDLKFVNTALSPVSSGHGTYWQYERHIRRCESALGILAYVAGANYSMRRKLWRTVAPHFADDCNSPLNVIEQRFRVVYCPEAMALEVAAESGRGLMKRRIRMVTRDLEAILSRPSLLNPFLYPGISWSLWSHKLMRWFVAPLLVALLVVNSFLLDRVFFQATCAAQLAFYMIGIIGHFAHAKNPSRWLSLPIYFTASNLAVLLGLAQVLRRNRAATWQPGGTM
jgi:cellulose synthase/poly-beta-1,6-N-acetylglucosamine synthase-like glycosyltransferase